MMLRSMKQARYSTECTGHFGLACKYYCHFTSPIRRYPDLQIHRIIKENLHGQLNEKRIAHYKRILPTVADDNSNKERRAEEAEREVIKLKEIEYMSEHIGEEFDGVVSGVTSSYIFVELENTVEGLIRFENLGNEYFIYDPDRKILAGEHTNTVYKIGQKVNIRVIEANKELRRISFEIVKSEGQASSSKEIDETI